MQSENRTCQSCKTQFIIEAADFDFYKKIDVPTPTFCPQCRLIRRLVAYSKRVLYKRKCDMCGQVKFGMYHPENPAKVYCNECWWSDKWDGSQFARDYDFSVPFFEQFKKLLGEVPWMALGEHTPSIINSPYTNCATELKNCYLVFYADFVEDSYYCDSIDHSKDCLDSYIVTQSEKIFDSVNVNKCSNAYYCLDCEDSYNIYLSKNLVGCSDCFGCVNLRKKQYCIFNEQYTKEEYLKKLKEFNLGSRTSLAELQKKFLELAARFPVRFMHGRHNVDVTGDYTEGSKSCSYVFDSQNVEDSKHCLRVYMQPTRDCYDYCFYGNNATLLYECLKSGGDANNLKFSNGCFPGVRNLTYCSYVVTSSDMFGCVAMRNKQYCILNKQYTKEEYEALVPKIIEQMKNLPYKSAAGHEYRYGEFFPIEFSPFMYNEGIAQEFFPLTKAEAVQKGLGWRDQEEKSYAISKPAEAIPDSIEGVDESVLKETFGCLHAASCNEQCTKAFKIVPQELALYKAANIPLPVLCPNCRFAGRLAKRNPLKLWLRTCACSGHETNEYKNVSAHFHGDSACPNQFESSYAPEGNEIVYCEQCYQAEVA